ncbi:MAG TPA: alpha/beta hydrolase [Sphingomonas sp.]|jgi:pimeloyl-ACP methyl ester carboxylesterase|nr:alpha/beta hydrolase [Sphingomonas sp.]
MTAAATLETEQRMTDEHKDGYRSIWSYLAEVAFRQDYVTVGDVRVRYAEAGDPAAPTVIMLHGTGGHWEAFCANIGPFAQHFHVLAFDMVGAGFSSKPDRPYRVDELARFVKAFMDAKAIARAHLVGVSLGAQTSARFAIDFPAHVDRIVLVSPVGLTRLAPRSGDDSEQQMQRRAAIVRDTSWDSTKSIFDGLIHDPRDVLDDLVSIRQRIHRMPGAERDMLNVFAMIKPEHYLSGSLGDDELATMRAPTLAFVSEHDAPFFKESARVIGELAPDARVVPLGGVAHWAQFETCDYFNDTAIAFLKG